jgi:hypothetical protein
LRYEEYRVPKVSGLTLFGWLAAAILAPSLAAQGTADVRREGSYWVRTIRGSVPAAGVSRLRVGSRGVVSVDGEDRGDVEYILNLRVLAPSAAEAARRLGEVEQRATRRGPLVQLLVGDGGPGLLPHDLAVRVPRSLAHAHVETLGGRVNVRGLAGDVQAESAGGPIAADRIGGSLVARTGGGAIDIGSVDGPLRCLTGGGNITVTRCGGEAWFETGGGKIEVGDAGGPVQATTGGGDIEIHRVAGTVGARTGGGMIRIQEAAGMVQVDSAGGAIQIGAARGVRCQSAAGGIRLRSVSGPLNIATSVGSIQAELLASLPLLDSFLNTGSGDITVFIPSNMAVTVRAQNVSPGQFGRIISDFPEIRVQSRTGGALTVAEGALNGGGPMLRIAAAEGTIFLRRLK